MFYKARIYLIIFPTYSKRLCKVLIPYPGPCIVSLTKRENSKIGKIVIGSAAILEKLSFNILYGRPFLDSGGFQQTRVWI